eukprot:CAMPEP_0197602894 /NCGR_PEP_ID=MMETSP1326-20131121/38123_1 /TAXON_ID=1155430 /ORGANISM="Genus nov. species nov., Strain RCC2288" /LENGTH=71 /DNA_ID=CAMNT_0043170329 /DNA_START=366 /DNA_END=578 /DNA_ORIENTATION=+
MKASLPGVCDLANSVAHSGSALRTAIAVAVSELWSARTLTAPKHALALAFGLFGSTIAVDFAPTASLRISA